MGKNKEMEKTYLTYLERMEKHLQREIEEIHSKKEKYLSTEKGIDRYAFLLDNELNMTIKEIPTFPQEVIIFQIEEMFKDTAKVVITRCNTIQVIMDLITIVFPKSKSCTNKEKSKVYVINNKERSMNLEESHDKISGLLETEYFKERLDKIYELGFRIEFINCFPE